MVVVVLLLVALVAILVPRALRDHEARRAAFVVSFTQGEPVEPAPPLRSPRVQRRREILTGLLIAMAGTGLVGLVPMFHMLLAAHLFLVDAFLGYVGLLAHMGEQRIRGAAAAVAAESTGAAGVASDPPLRPPVPLARRRASSRPALPAELPPVAAAG
jgi:hypothetical protein